MVDEQQRIVNSNRIQKRRSIGHRPNQLEFQLGLLILLLTNIDTTVTQQTQVPQDYLYYYVGCYTERPDLLKESIYAKTPQTCIEICEHQGFRYAILYMERCFCSNNVIQEDRQDEKLCNSRCLADKSQYCGGVGVHSYYSTMVNSQTELSNLRVSNVSENSITIDWDAYKPLRVYVAGAETTPMQQITNFLIKVHLVKTYSTLPFFPQPEFIVQNTETRFEITDLHPATQYNVSVKAICGQTTCGNASILAATKVGVPSPTPKPPRVLSNSDSTITIEIPPIHNDNGPLTKIRIVVERVDDALSQMFDESLLGSWDKAQNDGLPYYIAAELDYDRPSDRVTRKFIVGDGKRYGPYNNPPLDTKKTDIHVSLGVVSTLDGITKILYNRASHDQHSITMENFTYSTFESGQQSIIALIVTCIIFGTCLALSVATYIYLRYKTFQTRNANRRMGNTHEMTMQQPIIERENNGFVVEDELPTAENFKQQLNALVNSLDAGRRLPRNTLRMNVNDIVAEGRYGEVITGKIVASALPESDCQLHVLALDDLSSKDQAHLLQDFRHLTHLQRHEHILDFYGVSASADWFYFVFEYQSVSLKRRLIESRRAPNSASMQRITALSEQLILQWIYELASALEYLGRCKVVHKQLCSHSIFVTAEAKIKLSVFGPLPYISNQKKVDISRWLAPEALRYQHFSTKSDVWSFACVAWECCTLGATPYANITSSPLLLDAIKSGSRPAQPSFVYQDLYQLLLNCWQLEPSERINFEDIAFNVRQLMTSPRHALCFDRIPDSTGNNVLDTLPYYLPMLEMLN